MAGGVVSATNTSVEQVLEQMPLVVFRFKVKEDPQALPAMTFTVDPLVAPEMEPFPVIVQE